MDWSPNWKRGWLGRWQDELLPILVRLRSLSRFACEPPVPLAADIFRVAPWSALVEQTDVTRHISPYPCTPTYRTGDAVGTTRKIGSSWRDEESRQVCRSAGVPLSVFIDFFKQTSWRYLIRCETFPSIIHISTTYLQCDRSKWSKFMSVYLKAKKRIRNDHTNEWYDLQQDRNYHCSKSMVWDLGNIRRRNGVTLHQPNYPAYCVTRHGHLNESWTAVEYCLEVWNYWPLGHNVMERGRERSCADDV